MTHAPPRPDSPSVGTLSRLAQIIWQDYLLLSAFLFAGVLVSYQLIVTWLQPFWGAFVTNWLRAGVAWLAFVTLALVGRQLTKASRPHAWSWWILSLGMLSYALGQSLASSYPVIFSAQRPPFPWWTEVLFLLEYLFFVLALAFWPGLSQPGRPRHIHWKVVFDSLLLMGAVTALAWYFVLAPLYLQSQEPISGRIVNIAYTSGDLGLLFGLILVFVSRRPARSQAEQAALFILILAVVTLIWGDTWFAWLNFTAGYMAATPPALLWMAASLLALLAGLVHLRLSQYEPLPQEAQPPRYASLPGSQTYLQDVARFLLPLVAALFACAMIAVRAIIAPIRPMSPLIPILVIFGLLVLVMLRQAITVLENAQLQRKWALADAQEQALQEANRRMEIFLGIAGHELKTPLTTIILSLQMLRRRLKLRAPPLPVEGSQRRRGDLSFTDLDLPLQQAERLNRLVNDLLDTSRIQIGQLALTLQRVDLIAIVRVSVEEQRQTFDERTINLQTPEEQILVNADAERIGQVVTNYLTNALKYSPESSPVDVGVQVQEEQRALVWVRDQGPGLKPAEQEQVWERFYRAPGVEIASGSGVGLGLGLHISKTIITQHEGQVGVHSAPGQGATFWFALPLAQPADAC